jgi:hypothetical protein
MAEGSSMRRKKKTCNSQLLRLLPSFFAVTITSLLSGIAFDQMEGNA